MELERFVRTSIAGMKPPTYPVSEGGFLRMDANTNLVGLNPAVERALRRYESLEINHYPTALSDDLRAALAAEHGVGPDHVIVGNGSDEVIDFVMKTFVNPGDVVAVPAPTFVMYPFYGRVNLARVVEVPLKRPGFNLELDGLLRVRAKVVLIASPNNPTGNAFPASELERLLFESKGVVVVDEAYADFCGQDLARRVREFDNLIVLRTFSKAHGLAGVRVGYAVGQKPLIDRLYCVKPAFDVGTLPEQIAIEALRDKGFLTESVRLIGEERPRLASALTAMGFEPAKSDANFMLVDFKRPAEEVRAWLRSKKILTRDMSDFKGLETFGRVTIGRREHNDALVSALRDLP